MADKEEQELKTIAEDLVVTKYKMAGDLANRKFEIRNNRSLPFLSPDGAKFLIHLLPDVH